MQNMKNLAFVVLILCIPLVFWGWAYEVSYFSVIGLDVNKSFGSLHYIYSSLTYLVILFIVIVTYGAISKFFSKNIDRNDSAEFKEALAKTEFIKVISDARVAFLFSLGVWLIVFFAPDIRVLNWLGRALGENFMLLIWFNILLFSASLYLSPQHSKFAVILAFVLSIGVCFSMGGLAHARLATKIHDKVIRNDFLVVITKEDGKYVADAKSVEIPLPSSLKKYLSFLE